MSTFMFDLILKDVYDGVSFFRILVGGRQSDDVTADLTAKICKALLGS